MATRMLGVIVYSVLKRLRLPVSIVAALVVAEAAVLIMRPRGGIEPVDAEPQTYFSAAFIERAEDFRSGQLRAVRRAAWRSRSACWSTSCARPPARLKGPFRRPVLAGAATAVALSVAVTVLTLPVSAISRERAQGRRAGDPGLGRLARRRRQGHRDRGRASSAPAARCWCSRMRRFGRHWWAPAAALVVAFGVVHDLREPDPHRAAVQHLQAAPGRRAALRRARARRRGGRQGRRGLRDGRLAPHDRRQRLRGRARLDQARGALRHAAATTSRRTRSRLVVAHELGHVHYHDVPRGLLYLAIVAPFGMFAVARLSERLAPAGRHPARGARRGAVAGAARRRRSR